jgi:hypothetical protein
LPEGGEQALEGPQITFVGRRRQRFLDTMVARDHVGVDGAHCRRARGGFARRVVTRIIAFAGATRFPTREPCIRHMRVGKQRTQRRAVARSSVGQPPPCEREVDAPRVEQRQPVVGQRGIVGIIARIRSTESELGALAAEQPRSVMRGKRRDHFRRHRNGFLRVVREERQQRLGEAREVPTGDAGLVAERIAPATIDRAEDRGGIVGFHESAWPVVDGLARDRHVVGIHDAMDEPHVHPLRDQRRLALGDTAQQRQVGLRRRREGRVVAGDRVVGQLSYAIDAAVRAVELERADPDVARCRRASALRRAVPAHGRRARRSRRPRAPASSVCPPRASIRR